MCKLRVTDFGAVCWIVAVVFGVIQAVVSVSEWLTAFHVGREVEQTKGGG